MLSNEPKDVDISHGLIGSGFGVSEIETVACSIVIISRRKGGWFPFTWEGYCNLCDHKVNAPDALGHMILRHIDSEDKALDEMVKMGALEKKGPAFNVTEKFIHLCKGR